MKVKIIKGAKDYIGKIGTVTNENEDILLVSGEGFSGAMIPPGKPIPNSRYFFKDMVQEVN